MQYATFLAFEQLSVSDRILLLAGLLVKLSTDEVSAAVKDSERLGLAAEASLIGLSRPDELTRYLPVSDVQRLGVLVTDTLIARLPEPLDSNRRP